jgi:hypothetical protein
MGKYKKRKQKNSVQVEHKVGFFSDRNVGGEN